MTPAKLNVLIALFAYGGNGGIASILPDIAYWLMLQYKEMLGDERIGNIGIRKAGDIPLTMARNEIVKMAKLQGFDVILMIDSDQVPDLYVNHKPWAKPFWKTSFDFIYERAIRGLPSVVCAPYCGPPSHPTGGGYENVYVFQAEENDTGELEEGGTGFRFIAYDRNTASRMRGIQQIAAGPTGLILYTTDAFDLMPVRKQTKSEILDDFAAGKLPKDRALRLLNMESWFFYEYTDQFQTQKASTEDVTNTREIQLAGIAKHGEPVVFCNWDSWAGHMKPKCVGMPEPITLEHISPSYIEAVSNGLSDHEELRELNYDCAVEGQNGTASGAYELVEPEEGKEPPGFKRYWSPCESNLKRAVSACQGANLIVDVGPGHFPFSEATEFVGRIEGEYNGVIHEIDIEKDRLPYEDKEVDFLYCRHTLEDLTDPFHLLSEIARVAKRGWIETPSPLAECCHGVDNPEGIYHGRGYVHHNWIVWTDRGVLTLMRKYSIINDLNLDDDRLQRELSVSPERWNHVYQFSEAKPLSWKELQHEIDFNLQSDYGHRVVEAIGGGLTTIRASVTKRRIFGRTVQSYGHQTADTDLKGLQALVKYVADRNPDKHLRVLEVGSWVGESAIALQAGFGPAGGTVFCVDNWEGNPSDHTGAIIDQYGSDEALKYFKSNLEGLLGDRVKVIRGGSLEVAESQDPAECDLIFIDANHDYEQVKADIAAWLPHVAETGILCGHDYCNTFEGVVRAVDELCDEYGTDPRMIAGTAVWWIRKSQLNTPAQSTNEHQVEAESEPIRQG